MTVSFEMNDVKLFFDIGDEGGGGLTIAGSSAVGGFYTDRVNECSPQALQLPSKMRPVLEAITKALVTMKVDSTAEDVLRGLVPKTEWRYIDWGLDALAAEGLKGIAGVVEDQEA